MSAWMSRLLVGLVVFALGTGCSLIPDISHQPSVHNPYPQLSKVAVLPFFNLSTEPSVDGRQFALAYMHELQQVPGYEVVPVGVVERAVRDFQLTQNDPKKFQQLAQLLEVDAVVVGAVTDYNAYYPPRCTMHVEWYAANPHYHRIPAGYGLPWGTPEEEFIPAPLVFEAEMELARAQLKTQTPAFDALQAPPPEEAPPAQEEVAPESSLPGGMPPGELKESKKRRRLAKSPVKLAQTQQPIAPPTIATPNTSGTTDTTVLTEMPDARCFIPRNDCGSTACQTPDKIEPVMQHTKAYDGSDSEFTEALASYYHFRDDARFGGWQAYLQRSDDFIRFCCRLHIYEMLSARGGAGQSRVVWRWSADR
jgi:hypothetical protein